VVLCVGTVGERCRAPLDRLWLYRPVGMFAT